MKKYKIFVAFDTTNINKAKKIIKNINTKKLKIGYKFGLEFINSKNGRSFNVLIVDLMVFGISCNLISKKIIFFLV